MSAKKTFYVTTPIYYANAEPHVGSAYTTIAADVLARWHRLKGNEVFFLTGTDEHGQKIQETAEKNKKNPQKFVDEIAKKFEEAFKLLNISNNYFIRTTNPQHEKEVKKILLELYKKKLIYKGVYETYYCVGCEQYITRKDLVDGKCPLHQQEPTLVKEESYMFRLSAFQDKLLNLIKSGKYCILPVKKRNEVISFLESGLQDIPISRKKSKVSWGIELPFDKDCTCFVWVDAFWNYVTGLAINKKFKTFWPPNIQLMANDILRVHATIWPALLLATGYTLPKTLFIHGYFTVNGQKMSKSLGNVIDPVYIANNYGVDSLRYFLLREIPFGEDGDFSEVKLVERYNQELANDLGNLLRRTTVLVEKNFGGKIPAKGVDDLCKKLDLKKINEYIDKLELHNALNELWRFVNECNKYVNDKEPWNVKDKKKLGNILYNLVEALRFIAIVLQPFMPNTSEEIARQLGMNGFEKQTLKDLKYGKYKYSSLGKTKVLFEKIEIVQKKAKMEEEKMVKEHGKEIHQEDKIPFAEFQKIDLRVGKITKVQPHPDADKLYILLVDLGEGEHNIQLVAGLKGYYKEEELMNKQIVVVRNLQPATLRGVESQGMLLAAEFKGKVVLISPEKNIETGAKIR
jgi:methionyl-tRNA synthetase